jgi:hypothetical protein
VSFSFFVSFVLKTQPFSVAALSEKPPVGKVIHRTANLSPSHH